MVGQSGRTEKLSGYDIIFAGAASGFITRATCQPLDVLKIRFQLQVEPIKNAQTSKYRSLPQAVLLIAKEEGIKALWKGHVPAQLLSIVYGLVQFWTFEHVTQTVQPRKYKSLLNFGAGSLAGCAATVASFPFDVVRTRLVGQSEKNKIYSGVVDAFVKIVRNEGVLVLYRGILPTVIQVGPHAGVQFMCYKFFDELFRYYVVHVDSSSFSLSSSVAAGSGAGLIAKTVIYPLDLVKKRMQIQGVEQHRKDFGEIFVCKGMIDCLRKIFQKEGISGLFKGLHPSLLKAVATTALHFTAYEVVCKLISDIC